MGTLLRMILINMWFHRKRSVPAILLTLLFLTVSTVSLRVVSRIRTLANRPLESLKTELILQNESEGTQPDALRTRGVVLPFNLRAFPLSDLTVLKTIKEIQSYSTALVLWKFSLENNLTVVAIDLRDPPVGLRRIESMLMPKGHFFSSNRAKEVVLERHFSALFGFKLHGTYTLAGEALKVVGIVDFKEQSNLSSASVFLPYQTGVRLAQLETPLVNQVFLSLASSSSQSVVVAKLSELFPGFSVITKDRLFKNLSGLNRMIYTSGDYFIGVVWVSSLLMIFGVLKFYRKEFRQQPELFHLLGWPRTHIRYWVSSDLFLIFLLATLFSVPLSFILEQTVIHQIQIAPLLNLELKI